MNRAAPGAPGPTPPVADLLDAVTTALLVTDPEHRVTYWNAGMERLTGVPRAAALGRPVRGLAPLLDAVGLEDLLGRARSGEVRATAELPGGPEGPRWIESRCLPLGPGGRPEALVAFLADTTEERRRALFLRAMEVIGRSLTSSLDLNEVLDTIAGKALEVMAAQSALVVSWDGQAPEFRVLRALGRLSGEYASRGRIPVAGGPISQAVLEGRVVTTANILADQHVWLAPERRAQIEREGFKAVAAAPLAGKGRVHGALVVHYWTERTFSVEETTALGLMGEQAALAIDNARLYADATRRAERLGTLASLGQSISASLDTRDVMERVARGAAALRAGALAAVHVYDESVRALRFAAWSSPEMLHLPERAHEGLPGLVLEQRAPVLVADPRRHARTIAVEWWAKRPGASYYGVPILVGEGLVGVLDYIVPDGTPDAEEQEALRLLATQAGVAIRNAELYASAQESLARLRETQAQLVQAGKMSALGQLVSGVAHEINNPLSVIIGYGQLLLHRQVPEPFRRPIELMVGQAERMAKIVRNLLYFARQRRPERVAVDLNQVIEQTLGLRQHQLVVSGITVETDLAPDLPAVTGDVQQLQQVFLNLLLNAEQAITGVGVGLPRPRQGGRIVFRTERAGDRVRAHVIDDGPGIPPEVLPRVFEPFFTTKEVGAGTGLGLSVSYGIVEEHGGRLTVESQPGRTVFTLELPVGGAAETRPPAAGPPPRARGRGRGALVVEDEPGVAEFVVTLLRDNDWAVDLAPGGHAALELVRQRAYDLIVSDMRMPQGGGEELYRRLLVEAPALARRFIFLTGDTANPQVWAFLREHDVTVVEKPFRPEAFLEAVARVAGGNGGGLPR
jgi:signal transduction histidine kinase/CheY-like chemotaxis protein